jgi:hypothetical protein
MLNFLIFGAVIYYFSDDIQKWLKKKRKQQQTTPAMNIHPVDHAATLQDIELAKGNQIKWGPAVVKESPYRYWNNKEPINVKLA